MKLSIKDSKWFPAPRTITFGHDMMIADISITKDETLSIHCHKNGLAQIEDFENSEWLTTAHMLCTDFGIPQGHISDRMKQLAIDLQPITALLASRATNGA